MNYVDLFSGSGGLSLGFDQAGFDNIFSVDIDPSFNKTYRKNFPDHTLVEEDITLLSDKRLRELANGHKIDVVVGGPPCQGFSMAGNIGRRFIDDPRNKLFQEFARVLKVLKPDYFMMENVARMYTHNNGKTLQEVLAKFKELGYYVEARVINTVDYSIPQQRRRVIFIGTKLSRHVEFPVPDSDIRITVKQAIGDLPDLTSKKALNVANHVAMNHTPQMLKKMSYIKDGGTRLQIPEDLRPLTGDVRKYIRYDSNKPSVCITGDMRKVFHYKYNRALTVRELARIQTYPDSFVFEGSTISQQQQVGNSVPPLLAKRLAVAIVQMAERDKLHAAR